MKTIGVVLAAAGMSIGGVTGALKNSAQSMLVRLRQDTYTDLATEGITGAAAGHNKARHAHGHGPPKLTPITET